MLTYNTKAIVSLTSHKTRVKHCGRAIYSAIKNCLTEVHVVLCLYKDDIKYIHSDVKTLIDAKIVELLIVDEDLGPHTKYFYTMKKYKNLPIITIDDDQLYYPDTIPSLIDCYDKNKNYVICRQYRTIHWRNGKVLPFSQWVINKSNSKEGVRKNIHPMGVGMILYPPDILKISDNNLSEIRKYRMADDIYLNALEFRYNVSIYSLPYTSKKNTLWDEVDHKNKDMTAIALREDKNRFKLSDYYVKCLSKDFNNVK